MFRSHVRSLIAAGLLAGASIGAASKVHARHVDSTVDLAPLPAATAPGVNPLDVGGVVSSEGDAQHFEIQMGTSDLQNAESVRHQASSRPDDQSQLQFQIQVGTSDLQDAENLGSQSKSSRSDGRSEVQFQIQVGTSDLQNAENVPSQAERR